MQGLWRTVIRIAAVLSADLRTQTRSRGRGFERTLFVVVLLVAVAFNWPSTHDTSLRRMTRFGTELFYAFYIAAYVGLFVMVPSLFGSAFTAERRGENAELLFTTPIRGIELVGGRFLSNMARILLLLGCGLPVLFSALLFGGVSGGQMGHALLSLISFAVIVGGFSFLLSVLAGRGGAAGTAVIVLLLGQGLLALLVIWVLSEWVHEPSIARWLFPYLSPQFALAVTPFETMPGTGSAWGIYVEAIGIGLLFLGLSAALIRPLAIRGSTPGPAKSTRARKGAQVLVRARGAGPAPPDRAGASRFQTATLSHRQPYRGPVWKNPVTWKEVMITIKGSWLETLIFRLLVWVGLPLVLLFVLANEFELPVTNAILLVLEFTLVAFMTSSKAATSFVRERDEGRLDLLAVTPLSSTQIWIGKTMGILRSLLPIWILLGIHFSLWLLGGLLPGADVQMGGYRYMEEDSAILFPLRFLPPLAAAVCLIASVGLIYSIGMLVSLFAKKTSTAHAVTIVILLVWWVGLPTLMAMVDMDFFVETTGALNPYFFTVGWSVSQQRHAASLDDLLLPTIVYIAFAVVAFTAINGIALGRLNRLISRN